MNSPSTYYFIQDQVYDRITNIIERAHAQFAGAMPVTNYVNLCRAQWNEYKPLNLNCNNKFDGAFYFCGIAQGENNITRPLPKVTQNMLPHLASAFINQPTDFYIGNTEI